MTRLAYVMSTSFVVLAIAGRSSVSITPKLIWNASASAPVGLYTVRTAADLGVTDLVAVDAPEPLASFLKEREYLPRGVPLMKRIAALPGQTVCRIGRNVSVDTIAMGEALARDRRGRELPVWQGCRTLRPSEIFLMNWDVRDSLDGRYFGPIPKNSIIGRALPLWTDEGGDGASCGARQHTEPAYQPSAERDSHGADRHIQADEDRFFRAHSHARARREAHSRSDRQVGRGERAGLSRPSRG